TRIPPTGMSTTLSRAGVDASPGSPRTGGAADADPPRKRATARATRRADAFTGWQCPGRGTVERSAGRGMRPKPSVKVTQMRGVDYARDSEQPGELRRCPRFRPGADGDPRFREAVGTSAPAP